VNTPVSGSKITLDAGSAVLSSITIQALSGATLTIDSGTTVLMIDSTGVFQPVPAGSTVLVALDDGDSSSKVEISGVTTEALFRISATVNGNAAELKFVSNNAATTSGMPVTGAHWTAILTDTAIHAGTRINLYRTSGGKDTLIGSQVVGVPVRVLAKKSAGTGQQTSVSPDGTGSFQAGADNGASSSSQATMPTSGVYWNTYSNIPDTSYDVNGVTVGGPLAVAYLEIGELSTAELVAGMAFDAGVTCASYTNPNDGAQYWAELTQGSDGKTTSIKIAASVANIFYLDLKLVSVADRTPILFVTGLQPDGNGVHAPDGSVLSDPYEDASLKFGGFKELKFQTKTYDDAMKISGYITDAGYGISHERYENKVFQLDAVPTLDGRKKIEEDVLRPKGWLPRPATATWRNRGFYDHNDTLYINIDSHGSGDKVNQMVQTISGTFTNANGDPDTVQRMNVAWVIGLTMDSIPATLTSGGTAFSVACSLFTGDNTFIFMPYVNDQNGQLTYQTHQVVKAKGVRVNPFILNYKETRNSLLTIHMRSMTYTQMPDSAVVTDDQTVTAQLTMTPYQELLNNIKSSASATATCASTQTCRILDGASDSTQMVTVAETWQKNAVNCERKLPLIDMGHWSGNMSFNAKGVAHVGAGLVPLTGSDTTRNYFLYVVIEPTYEITSHPNTAGSGQIFDCVDSVWKDVTENIEPHISLTRDDTPQVLLFGSSQDLEDYVTTPTGAKTWAFSGTKGSIDSGETIQYDATLTVSGP
jgi:hypothetical protein